MGKLFTDRWYNQGNDLENPKSKNKARQFTQLTWKSSTKLGCGIGIPYRKREFFGVARYAPTADDINTLIENVPKN